MKSVIAGLILGALAALPAYTQDSSMRAQIPFPFHVGTTVFSSGEYEVARIAAPNAWLIRQPLETGCFFLARSEYTGTEMPETSVLIFHRYGRERFLAEVRVANQSYRGQLTPSVWERELKKSAVSSERAAVEVIRADTVRR